MATCKPQTRGSLLRTRQRVAEIADLMLHGATKRRIAQHIAESGIDESSIWFGNGRAKISRRMIHEYIRRATALNAAIVQKDRQSRVAFQIARRNCLYRKATEVNDLRTGLAVLKELAKIQGLYPTATQTNRDGNLECSLAERDGAG